MAPNFPNKENTVAAIGITEEQREQMIDLYYKHKKNRSMLRAVELKYGINSPHFKHLQAIVETDEKKSQMINDFK